MARFGWKKFKLIIFILATWCAIASLVKKSRVFFLQHWGLKGSLTPMKVPYTLLFPTSRRLSGIRQHESERPLILCASGNMKQPWSRIVIVSSIENLQVCMWYIDSVIKYWFGINQWHQESLGFSPLSTYWPGIDHNQLTSAHQEENTSHLIHATHLNPSCVFIWLA